MSQLKQLFNSAVEFIENKIGKIITAPVIQSVIGGGEVRIHGTDGKIRNSNTIGKPDPNPPRDTKH